MMKKQWNARFSHRPLDYIFILILLCVFAAGSLLAVILGANVYREVTSDVDDNFQVRTTLSYLSTKIRQGDDCDAVRVEEKDGVNALVLESFDGEELCETWIYAYDGFLCETYFAKGTPFELEYGLQMIPSYGLNIEMNGRMIYLQAANQKGEWRSLTLSLRADEGDKRR